MGQVSSCANALKAFFRELREPAFNTTSYADIIQLMDEGASYNRKSLKLEQNPFLSPFAAESLFGVKGEAKAPPLISDLVRGPLLVGFRAPARLLDSILILI